MTKPFRNRGTGTAVWAEKPDSTSLGNTGIVAPGRAGWIATPEPWEQFMCSAGRFMPSEDMQVKFLQFYVVVPASVNDRCDIGILDQWGDIIYHSGLTTNLMTSAGMKYHLPTSALNLIGGRPYYAAFGYGAVGGVPATLLTACYPGAPDFEGYGAPPQQYPFQPTAIWTTADGHITAPSAASGAISPYVNWGEAVAMFMRII